MMRAWGALGLTAAVLAGCGGRGAATPEPTTPEAESVPQPSTAAPLPSTMATLYFPSGETGLLAPESREILATPAAGDRARQILSDLLSGPTQSGYLAAAPPGTRLLQVYVLRDGTAYADFSAELRTGIDAGSEPEILTVYSIVNSLAFNIPEIDRVGILVQGRACDSLNGHLDLRQPLRPNWRIIDRDGGASTPSDEPQGEPPPPGQVVRHGPMIARRG